jgi:hypothetical protein
MITRRPHSSAATRRDHPAQDPQCAQGSAGQVKEQAKSRKRVSRKADKRKGRRPTARRAASDALAGAVARREAIFTETVHEAVSVIPEEYRVDRVTDPVEAVAPLDATRLAVEGLGRRYAQAMGCYSWLFWLRRLPSEVFSGGLATSGPYWRAVAEVMSSWTTTAEYFGDKSFRSVIPPISDSQLESLMKLCSLARLLGTVHGVIRRAGKGESVRWLRHGLPLPVSDPELDEMISLYDERHLSQAGFRAGTQPFKFQPFFAKLIEPGSWEQCALVVREAPEIAPVTYWRGPYRKKPTDQTWSIHSWADDDREPSKAACLYKRRHRLARIATAYLAADTPSRPVSDDSLRGIRPAVERIAVSRLLGGPVS